MRLKALDKIAKTPVHRMAIMPASVSTMHEMQAQLRSILKPLVDPLFHVPPNAIETDKQAAEYIKKMLGGFEMSSYLAIGEFLLMEDKRAVHVNPQISKEAGDYFKMEDQNRNLPGQSDLDVQIDSSRQQHY